MHQRTKDTLVSLACTLILGTDLREADQKIQTSFVKYKTPPKSKNVLLKVKINLTDR